MGIISVFLLSIWLTAAGTLFAAEPLRYEPEIVYLSGTVVTQDHFGSPNYSEAPETDMNARSRVLELDEPVSVRGNPNDDFNSEPVNNLKRIQLVIHGSSGIDGDALIGRHVTLEGTLSRKLTGWHITDVLMEVTKVDITNK